MEQNQDKPAEQLATFEAPLLPGAFYGIALVIQYQVMTNAANAKQIKSPVTDSETAQ